MTTKEYTGTLSGSTVTHLHENTGWGKVEGESPASFSAWEKISSAPRIKKGFGYQVRVTLTAIEIEELVSYLDSFCGLMESISAEERGGESAFRTIRRDCERWAELVGM